MPSLLKLPRYMLSYIHPSQFSASFESYFRPKFVGVVLWQATFRMFSLEILNPYDVTLVIRNFTS